MNKMGKILLLATLLILLVGVVSATETAFNECTDTTDAIVADDTSISQENKETNNNDEGNMLLNESYIYPYREVERVCDWTNLNEKIDYYYENFNYYSHKEGSRYLNKTLILDVSIYRSEDTITWYSPGTLTIDGNGQTINGNRLQPFRVEDSSLILKNMIITNSIADEGGAISAYHGSNLIIINCTLYNNKANAGGAICGDDHCHITIINSTIYNNQAQYSGGAINNDYYTTIINSTIYNNTAKSGGAISSTDTLTIINSTINNNTANEDGGAIDTGYSYLTVIDNSELNENYAKFGGAINIYNGYVSVVDSRLEKNYGSEYGGAIYDLNKFNSSNVIVKNSNFTENYGGNGAAIYCHPYTEILNYDLSNNSFIRNNASNHETLNLVGTSTLCDNIYISTEIALKNVNLSVKDGKKIFEYGEDVVLNFITPELENPDNYDQNLSNNPKNSLSTLKNILDNREYKTIYVNDKKNTTTNLTNYTLSNLIHGKYTVYYTYPYCGYKSNTISFTVTENSDITTDKLAYDYDKDIINKIILHFSDNSEEKGHVDISVKDGEEYIKLLSYSNIKDGKSISIATIIDELESLYTTLNSEYTINVTYNSNNIYVNPSSTEFTLNINKQNTSNTHPILKNTRKPVKQNTNTTLTPDEPVVTPDNTKTNNKTVHKNVITTSKSKNQPTTNNKKITTTKVFSIKRANDTIVLYQGDNIVTLDELNKIFNTTFDNGWLVLYINGEVVFNDTVNDDLATVIIEIIDKFLGEQDIKVEFTDNNNNTNSFEEKVIIE